MPEIARCESKFRQFGADGEVLHGVQVYADSGMFQVNKYYHEKTAAKYGYNLDILADNMAYSRLLQSQQGYWPWISSWPCWGKTSAATSFNVQNQARLAAKGKKVTVTKADLDAIAQAQTAAAAANAAATVAAATMAANSAVTPTAAATISNVSASAATAISPVLAESLK